MRMAMVVTTMIAMATIAVFLNDGVVGSLNEIAWVLEFSGAGTNEIAWVLEFSGARTNQISWDLEFSRAGRKQIARDLEFSEAKSKQVTWERGHGKVETEKQDSLTVDGTNKAGLNQISLGVKKFDEAE